MSAPAAADGGWFPKEVTPEQIRDAVELTGGRVPLWVSFGHVRTKGVPEGVEHFSRNTFDIYPDGHGVRTLRRSGDTLVGYPFGQGRTLRVLVRDRQDEMQLPTYLRR